MAHGLTSMKEKQLGKAIRCLYCLIQRSTGEPLISTNTIVSVRPMQSCLNKYICELCGIKSEGTMNRFVVFPLNMGACLLT